MLSFPQVYSAISFVHFIPIFCFFFCYNFFISIIIASKLIVSLIFHYFNFRFSLLVYFIIILLEQDISFCFLLLINFFQNISFHTKIISFTFFLTNKQLARTLSLALFYFILFSSIIQPLYFTGVCIHFST